MRLFVFLASLGFASPAFAASGPFFSLANTNFVVLLAFILFVAILVVLKVPGKIGSMLDDRAKTIENELEEARALRDEAQTLLASYERKKLEVQAQADRIVAHAKLEAAEAGEQAKADLEHSISRRLQAAEDQIAQAEANAVKEVRNKAVNVAVAAAREVVAKGMSADDSNKLIDESIDVVGAKLH